AAAAALALAAWPVASLLREGRRFADPVYTVPFERPVSEAAAALAGPHRVHWVGRDRPLRPRDHLFDRADPSTSSYLFGPPVIEYHTGKPVHRALAVAGPPAGLLVLPQSFGVLEDGDAVLFSPQSEAPLTLLRMRQVKLAVGEDGAVTADPGSGPLVVELRREGTRYGLQAHGVPASWVAVRLELAKAEPIHA